MEIINNKIHISQNTAPKSHGQHTKNPAQKSLAQNIDHKSSAKNLCHFVDK